MSNNTVEITNITQFNQTKDIQDIQFLKQNDGKYLVFASSNSEIQYYKIFTNETQFQYSQSLSTIYINYNDPISNLQLVVSELWIRIMINNNLIHLLQLLENDTYSRQKVFQIGDGFTSIVSDITYNDVIYMTDDKYLALCSIQAKGIELMYLYALDISEVELTQIGFMKEGIFLFEQSNKEQFLAFIPRESLKNLQVNKMPNLQIQTFSPSNIYSYSEKFFYNVQQVEGNQELIVYQVQPSSFNTIYQSIYFKSTIKQLSCSTNSFEQYDLCIVVFDTGLSEQVIIMHEQIIVLLNNDQFNSQLKSHLLSENTTYEECDTPQSIYNSYQSELTIICSNNRYVYDLKTQTPQDLILTNGSEQFILSASNQNGTVNSSIGLNFINPSSSNSGASSAIILMIILLVLVIVFASGGYLFYLRRKSLLLRQNNVLPEDNSRIDRYSEQVAV